MARLFVSLVNHSGEKAAGRTFRPGMHPLYLTLASLALISCGKNDPVADNTVAPPANVVGDAGATGLAAPDNAGAAEAHDEAALPAPSDGMRWTASADGQTVGYGPPGLARALTITCARTPAAHLIIERGVPAPSNGKGTLSLTGDGHVASLPIEAVGAGPEHIWQAEAAGDLRSAFEKVFAGGGNVQVKLANVADLVVPAEPVVARLFAACR